MNKIIFKALSCILLISVGILYSCTDTWDEHYEGNGDSESFDGTIMEYLKQNPSLSDFAEIVEATGYDTELSSSQSYTLWAPVNGSFDKNEWLELAKTNKNDVITRFIKNHIARYNVSVDNQPHRIKLINTKSVDMTDLSASEFGTADITNANIVCGNGVVHTISAAQPYLPNIYEQIEKQYKNWKKAQEAQGITVIDDSVHSLYTFLSKYNADSLDQGRSVSNGVDENGEYIWIDSVMMRNNTILKGFDAMVYSEDSIYTVVLPSVEAYAARYEEACKYLRYNPMENQADGVDQKTATTDSLQKYYASTFAMNDLFYNNNFNTHSNDSVVSTQWKKEKWEFDRYFRPFDAGGIFSNGTREVCSNGYIYYCDDYPISIYDQFLRKIETTCSTSIDRSTDAKGADLYTTNCNISFPTRNVFDFATGKSFSVLDIIPAVSSNQVAIAFTLRNVLKTTYDVYLVYSPLWVTKYPNYQAAYEQAQKDSIAYAEGDKTKSTWMNDIRKYYFQVNTYERQGSEAKLPSDIGKYGKATSIKNPVDDSKNFITKVENPTDTMFVGQITPNYSYYNTDKEGVLLQFKTNITSKLTSQYSREMYFQKIILIPHKE